MKQTTKICPECSNTNLVHLISLNIKYCTECDTQIPWNLDEGQKPLLNNNRNISPNKEKNNAD